VRNRCIARFVAHTAEIEVGASERGAAQRREDPAFLRRFSCNGVADGRAEPRCLGIVFRQTARRGTNEAAIGGKTQHLEAREAALAQTRPVVLDRTGRLLRATHRSVRREYRAHARGHHPVGFLARPVFARDNKCLDSYITV
jgi:hypothetical protein